MDRETAVQLAKDNYWRVGLSALSLNELCRRVQLSKPALYREFGGEDGLLAAALDAYRAQVLVPMLSGLEEDRPFADMVEGVIVVLTSDRGTPAGCLFTKARISPSRLGPLAKEQVEQMTAEHRAAYEAWFRRALAKEEANPELSPELAALYVDTQVAAILVQMGIGIEPERIRAQARL
ncbi:MAG: TetR family transcriptional regulator, partial [Myxococcota bacterium]